jgi:hypothetical protein
MRDLTYHTTNHINGQLLETHAGIIMPTIATASPVRKIFYADNVDVTASELQALQNFYHDYYIQKFRFKDPTHSQKTLTTLEIPNGIIRQFTLNNDNPDIVYLLHSAKIYHNQQLIPNVTLNGNLTFTLIVPPTTGSLITVSLDYDYAVMFDYNYGLQSIMDSKTQTYKISFRLLMC